MSIPASPTKAVVQPEAIISAWPESDADHNAQANELEDRRIAEPFILREKSMLERRDPVSEHYHQTTGKPDLRPVEAVAIENAAASECEDANKLPEKGVHSLTQSVTDEFSRPVSEVEDDAHFDQSEVSSENFIGGSQTGGRDFLKEDQNNLRHESELEVDDFEGADGEIDSVNGGPSHGPRSEVLRRRIFSPSPNERLGEGSGEDEDEDGDGEVFQASHGLQDEQQPTEVRLSSLGMQRYPPQWDSEEFSRNANNLEEKKIDSSHAEADDAASNLRTLSIEPREDDEECGQRTRLDSEISLFYPQQLNPEDVINPFSLEVRIRKAREQQDIFLKWEAETIAQSIAGTLQPQVNLKETNRSILPGSVEISSDQPTLSSDRAVENGFRSEVRERMRTTSVSEVIVEDAKELSKSKPGVGEAVLLGALASGVNRPTWFVIRGVLVALVLSLFLLLHVAIKSDSWFVLLNVLFLISIAGGLILLLGWYVSEIGLVSVDKQMAELNLTGEPQKVESKTW